MTGSTRWDRDPTIGDGAHLCDRCRYHWRLTRESDGYRHLGIRLVQIGGRPDPARIIADQARDRRTWYWDQLDHITSICQANRQQEEAS